jgi:hypothetical protein
LLGKKKKKKKAEEEGMRGAGFEVRKERGGGS